METKDASLWAHISTPQNGFQKTNRLSYSAYLKGRFLGLMPAILTCDLGTGPGLCILNKLLNQLVLSKLMFETTGKFYQQQPQVVNSAAWVILEGKTGLHLPLRKEGTGLQLSSEQDSRWLELSLRVLRGTWVSMLESPRSLELWAVSCLQGEGWCG